MGAKQTEMVHYFFLVFFFSTVQNLKESGPSEHCTKPVFEDEMCPRSTK